MHSSKEEVPNSRTAILSVVCKDGVICVSDRAATLGSLYQADSGTSKSHPISSLVTFQGCGSASLIQKLEEYLTSYGNTYQKFGNTFTPYVAAKVLGNLGARIPNFSLGLIAGYNIKTG